MHFQVHEGGGTGKNLSLLRFQLNDRVLKPAPLKPCAVVSLAREVSTEKPYPAVLDFQQSHAGQGRCDNVISLLLSEASGDAQTGVHRERLPHTEGGNKGSFLHASVPMSKEFLQLRCF